MKPHTYSNVTLTDVKRRTQGIQVVVTYCNVSGRKSNYDVLVKNAPKGLDLRMSGERDHLCILAEEEIVRIQSQSAHV